MGKHLRKEGLIEEQEKREVQELNFGRNAKLRLEFCYSKKRKRHVDESVYLIVNCWIINYFPGIRLTSNEMDNLPSGSNPLCGYLRLPHLYNEKFGGLCALCDMETCRFPRVAYGKNEKECKIYVEAERRMIEEAQISIEVEKMRENGIII
ncbi:MAG: hypothetical protein AABW47_02060 [Nanoarchaeota archaeon]